MVITRHGKPAGVLIGFASEDDWFDYRLQNDARFLARIEKARKNLRRAPDEAFAWRMRSEAGGAKTIRSAPSARIPKENGGVYGTRTRGLRRDRPA